MSGYWARTKTLVRASVAVKGMVSEKSRSDRDRWKMKMFLEGRVSEK